MSTPNILQGKYQNKSRPLSIALEESAKDLRLSDIEAKTIRKSSVDTGSGKESQASPEK